MGGSGSGRHWSTVRSTTAECPSLDVRRLQRAGFLMPGRSFPCTWTGADKKASSIQVTVYEDRIELAFDCGSANTGQPGERYAIQCCSNGSRATTVGAALGSIALRLVVVGESRFSMAKAPLRVAIATNSHIQVSDVQRTAELSSEHKPFALVSAEPETCSSRSPRSPKACTV
jgi:hypothetical protein